MNVPTVGCEFDPPPERKAVTNLESVVEEKCEKRKAKTPVFTFLLRDTGGCGVPYSSIEFISFLDGSWPNVFQTKTPI